VAFKSRQSAPGPVGAKKLALNIGSFEAEELIAVAPGWANAVYAVGTHGSCHIIDPFDGRIFDGNARKTLSDYRVSGNLGLKLPP
jgi:hypothetical protein